MTIRRRIYLGVLGAAVVAWVVMRRVHAHTRGHRVPGGILVNSVGAYDVLSRILLGSFFRRIADDVAANAPAGARLLEVGCGPGHLSILLAQHGFDVTGLDLDPAMIERARGNAARTAGRRSPLFLVGDVASLPHSDESFDLVVSTLSMHHWDEPAVGLTELARVLRSGGRALIWDLGPSMRRHHGHGPDPFEVIDGSPLRVVGAAPWRWPWRIALTERLELVRRD